MMRVVLLIKQSPQMQGPVSCRLHMHDGLPQCMLGVGNAQSHGTVQHAVFTKRNRHNAERLATHRSLVSYEIAPEPM